MKQRKYICIHGSGTKANEELTSKEINKLHLDMRGTELSYHYIIPRNGEAQYGKNYNDDTLHADGHSLDSISICMVGGLENGNPNYNDAQYIELRRLCDYLLNDPIGKGAKVLGHIDLYGLQEDDGTRVNVKKFSEGCPWFDVKKWYYGE